MARLPDVTSLGERPTPRPAGGVAELRTATDPGYAGQGLQQAGQSITRSADALLADFKVEKEKQDTLRAEEAFTKLRERQLDLTYGEQDGFANKRGSDAVNGELFKGYTERLKDAARTLEEQLANPEQKEKFRQRTAVSALQFQDAILRHVASERRGYEKQVLDGTLAVEIRAATSQWNDNNAIGVSLARIRDIVNRQADNEGWAKAGRDAAILAAEGKVHNGVLSQMLATENYVLAKEYYEKHRDAIDAPTARAVLKGVEDGQQKQLANTYQSLFLSTQNDGRGLKILEKRVSEDKTLDEGRKNILLARIQSRTDLLERRALAVHDRQMRSLGRSIDQLNNDTFAGFEQSEKNLLPLLNATKGTELEADARRAIALATATRSFRLSSPGQQEAAISQAEATIRQDPSKFDRRVLDAWKQIHASQRQQVREDPITFAVRQGIAETKPLDLTKPAELGPAIAQRADIARGMRGTHQAPLRVLTTEEAGQVSNFLARATVGQKQEYFAGLSKATTGDREVYRSIMGQIAPDDPVTAIAGINADRGYKDREGRAVSSLILRGQEILNPPKKEDGKPVGGKPMPLPPQKDLDNVFMSMEGDAFAGMPRARADYYQTALSIYAARSAEAGDYSGALDRGRWREAIQLATGGIDRYRGKSVILPWGQSYGEFKSGIVDKVQQFALDGRLPEGISPRQLVNLPVENIGDGRYVFRTGAGAVVDKNGMPLVLDFNKSAFLQEADRQVVPQ